MTSLKSILPSKIEAKRFTLLLFDYSPQHYQCLLSSMNSPTAHSRMGDLGVRTPDEFDKMNFPCRLAPSLFSPKFPDGLDVDTDVYYLLYGPKDSPEPALIGGVSLMQRRHDVPPDMGWAVLEKYHGKGYAPEAATALMKLARDELGITEIMVWPGSGNKQSIRVAEKVGFQEGGKVHDEHGVEHVVYVLPGMKKVENVKLSAFGE